MKAKEIITSSLPVVRPEDLVFQVIDLMEEYKVSDLPLVDEQGQYIALLREDDLYNEDEDKKVNEIRFELFRPLVYENQNVFDVFNVLAQLKISVLPVLSKENVYIGAILINDLVFRIIDFFGLAQEGAVLLMRVKYIDYSITHIGNIIEANNAKIISLFTIPEDDTYQKVIIKVNTPDVVSLLETFERYEYEIENVLFDDEKYKEIYEERWDALMKYLSI